MSSLVSFVGSRYGSAPGACLPRWARAVAISLAIGLLPGLTGAAFGQQDIIAVPKNSKGLDWDWYARSESRELTFFRFSGLSPDYKLGVGDELQIQIVGFTGPFNFRIRSTGEVSIPQAGSVKVADLTAEEAEEAIAARFRELELIRDPEVLIYVMSYEAKKLWVYGQIDRPGEYTMSQQLTVMDAILMAGGLDFYGSRWGYLHRRNADTPRSAPPPTLKSQPDGVWPGHSITKLDLQAVRDGKGLVSPNPLVEDGDVIVIPTRYPTVVYVLGDVIKPGALVFENDDPVSVAQVLSQAGGPSKTAKISEGMVIRFAEDGTRKELPVDYLAILQGRQPDFEALSNDIIFIPGSAAKNVGAALMGTLPMLVSQVPSVH